MNFLMLLASYPLGDDTPIALYAIIGIVALGLVVASVFMSKKGKDQPKKKDNKKEK